jgi:hypothetical protein
MPVLPTLANEAKRGLYRWLALHTGIEIVFDEVANDGCLSYDS